MHADSMMCTTALMRWDAAAFLCIEDEQSDRQSGLGCSPRVQASGETYMYGCSVMTACIIILITCLFWKG